MMRDPAEQNIIDHVREYGWSVMKVAPAVDSDDPDEWFAYTIGLPNTFGWPELICFGLGTEVMGQLLNNAVDDLRNHQLVPQPGLQLNEVAEGFPVRLALNRNIPRTYFGYANWFARHSGKPMPDWLQLVWPDKHGKFPDDPDCLPEVVQMQTPLETDQ
jgi:hypothetical protein